MKLPKLQIKKSSLHPKSFRASGDAFNFFANNNNELPDIEKLTYLRGYPARDALRLQAGLALTRGNYKVTLKPLERRFGSTQVSPTATQGPSTSYHPSEILQICGSFITKWE